MTGFSVVAIATALVPAAVLFAWSFCALKYRLKWLPLTLLTPFGWFVHELYERFLKLWIRRRRERAVFLSELRSLLDTLGAATSVGLHVRQAIPREAVRFQSSALRGALEALECARLLGEDFNATLEREGRRLLSEAGEERYAGILFASLAVSERLGANTNNLLQALRARIDGRQALLRKIRIDTSQARFQGAVLCIAPFVLGGGYAFVFPKRFEFFLESSVGNGLLILIFALTLVCGAVTWRLVSRWTETIA